MTPIDSGRGVTRPSNSNISLAGGTGSTPSSAPALGRGVTRPSRGHPAHRPIVECPNRSVIVFLTVCVKDKEPYLANERVASLLRNAWRMADRWSVGRYVIMPGHLHLFCSPGSYPMISVRTWTEYWKGLVARAVNGFGPLATGGTGSTPSSAPANLLAGGTGSTPSSVPVLGRGVTRPSKKTDSFWQRDCLDTQLRRDENYSAKWEYVRNNPVRAELVKSADEWPYQGELNVLEWHD